MRNFEKYKTQTADLSAVFFIALIIIIIAAATVVTTPRLVATAVEQGRRCRSRILSVSVKLSATGYANVAVAAAATVAVAVVAHSVRIPQRIVIAATAMTAATLMPRVAAVISYL